MRLIFNCASSHVSASVVSVASSTIKLEAYAVEPLLYDASAEEQWLPSVGAAVRRLVGKSAFKGRPASVILPGSQLLTKTLKVPHVEAARQAQVIAFEAASNIPYPLSDVSWGYQVVHDDGVEVEVLLIFALRKLVDAVCKTFGQAGVAVMHVQAGSLMDLGALRRESGGVLGNCLLLNIGARSTNLVFTSESTYLLRCINSGGHSLTQSIADSLGRPPAEAEALKEAFQGSEVDSEDAATQTILQNNVDSFLRRLNRDVKQSLVNFRRQAEASAPERILICGRGSLLPGLKASLEEAHRLPVSVFDPLDGIPLGNQVDHGALEMYRLASVELLGEAAQLLDHRAPSVNLLPVEVKERFAFAKQKPFYAVAAAILALAPVPLWLRFQEMTAAVAGAERQVAAMEMPLREIHGELIELSAQAEVVREKTQRLERLVNTRSNWIGFLSQLQSSLQETSHVWLDSLSWEGNTAERLKVRGRILIFDWNPDRPSEGFRNAEARFRRLKESFARSPFVSRVDDNDRIDTSVERILGFESTLLINPETPL